MYNIIKNHLKMIGTTKDMETMEKHFYFENFSFNNVLPAKRVEDFDQCQYLWDVPTDCFNVNYLTHKSNGIISKHLFFDTFKDPPTKVFRELSVFIKNNNLSSIHFVGEYCDCFSTKAGIFEFDKIFLTEEYCNQNKIEGTHTFLWNMWNKFNKK